MKEILIIRHTTPNIEKGICYGASDIDVTNNFIEEASDIQKRINDFAPMCIYSSPLIRCSKLASFLYPNSNIQFDDRIKEMNFGDWEMKPWNSLKSVIEEWSSDFVNTPTPNGENFNQIYKRACNFVDDQVLNGNKSSRFAIITHSGIMRCLLSRYLKIPLNKVFRVKLNFGAIIKITLHPDFEEVEFIN